MAESGPQHIATIVDLSSRRPVVPGSGSFSPHQDNPAFTPLPSKQDGNISFIGPSKPIVQIPLNSPRPESA